MVNVKHTPQVELCSGVHEHDMDLMFVEEFVCSSTFADLFMSKIDVTDYQILKVVHSQYEEGNGIDVDTQARMVCNDNVEVDSRGESDITIIYTSCGKTKALLIEDKINACQQPNQYERYLARGRKAVKDGLYEAFDVFLVAPESYDAPKYGKKVTYEEIKAYFELDNTLRSVYKLTLISKALEKKTYSGIIIPDEKVMDFYDGYVKYVHDNHPNLGLITQAGQERGSKSNWFQYESNISNVDLIHQTLRECISIQINYGKENSEKKNAILSKWFAENMGDLESQYGFKYKVNKSSVSLKLRVPMLNTGDSIYNQIDKAEECFEALEKAIAFLYELRNKQFANMLSSI
jgi:hypothetical protein